MSTPASVDIYEGMDPTEIPVYPVAEAASYIRIAASTLRSWVKGRTYPRSDQTGFFAPLISLPDSSGLLSFSNLVEAHVLRALRTQHGVPIRAVRQAMDFVQEHADLSTERLLLSDSLRTDAGHLFLDKYGQLVELDRAGQMAMKRILQEYLKRIERDPALAPARLFPLYPEANPERRLVVIDPRISFGRPTIYERGVSIDVIVTRINAGETVEEIASDYDLSAADVEEAVVYRRAA